MGRASVAEYLVRAQRAGLLETREWEILSREDLEQRLYPPAPATTARRERPEVGWQEVNEELRRKGMTLSLIWEEYRERCPEGYQYSRFCELYREWRGQLDLSMRQSHRAGEKLFVDYCGDTVSVVDVGQVRQAQIFVAVWGASSYTFAEATWSQGLSDWIHSHVRAFEFGGGLTELVVPDNLRSGVTRACRYEPEINPT
jgi:transposase